MENEIHDIIDTKSIKKELRRDANVNAVLLFIFWLIYYAASLFLPVAVKLIAPEMDESNLSSLATLIFYIILYPIGFPVIFIIFRKISKGYKDQKIISCFRKPQMPAGWVAKWIFLTIGATYAAAYISSFLEMIFEFITGTDLNGLTGAPESNKLGMITTLISAPLFAPIFEELFFRGVLYRNVQNYGKWSMMIIGGLTFGIWHANYPQFLFAAVMGVFSCFLFEKTKSIIPSMIVHFIVNCIGATMLVLVSKLGLSDTSEIADMSSSLFFEHPFIMLAIMLAGLTIMAFLLLWFILMIIEITCHSDSFRISGRETTGISGISAFFTYMTAPLMIIAMLGMLGLTVFRALGGQI